ncbi:septation ring formation regulator EzrA [Hutsoniella sourekii]|uniref:septation ring formation regulator EzrA n=1 Tax=Hutsoniella sourekii TaxID=87650 RepID=UPI0004897B7A|nr:septation ring formation regulator EzrA [Hutsoniella sourekii]
MKFTDILFIIVILIVLGLGLAYYFKTQRNKEIEELNDRKNEMMEVPIADHLFTLKNMELSGQTKRKYESFVATWQTITNFQFAEIEAALVGAEQLSESMNLMKAKSILDEARELIQATEEEVSELDQEVEELLGLPEINQSRHEEYMDAYNEARSSITNHSFEYGPAIEMLEKNLQYLELDFTRYNELTSQGDYIEADVMLDKINNDLTTLQEILQKIPAMYETIKNDYEDSLDDLESGHKQMLAYHFNFEDDHVQEDVEKIREQLNEAKNKIKNADLQEAQTLMDKADREISSLYDFMEAEVDAQATVKNQLSRLESNLKIVGDNNRYARIEVDRISQSYILRNNELDRISQLTDQIQKDTERFNEISQQVEDNEVVYTKTANQLKKLEQHLEEIDDEQQELVKQLAQLNQREKEAKSSLDLAELDLRNLKRQIEKQHLPGLSESYYAKFYKVTDQIEYLSQQLNRVQIDMDQIEQLGSDLNDNLDQLEAITEEIVDSAALTEYMIQHSNRFRFDYPEIDQAINEAEFLFYDEYRYTEALNIIEKALRRVDSEGPTQVRRMYHQEKQHRNY